MHIWIHIAHYMNARIRVESIIHFFKSIKEKQIKQEQENENIYSINNLIYGISSR